MPMKKSIIAFSLLLASAQTDVSSISKTYKSVSRSIKEKISFHQISVPPTKRVLKNIPFLVTWGIALVLNIFIIDGVEATDPFLRIFSKMHGKKLIGLLCHFLVYSIILSCEVFGFGVGGHLFFKIKIVNSESKREASWIKKLLRGFIKYPPFFLLMAAITTLLNKMHRIVLYITIALHSIWAISIAISSFIGKGNGLHELGSRTELVMKRWG